MLLPLLLGQGASGGSGPVVSGTTGSPTITPSVTYDGVLGTLYEWAGAGTITFSAGGTVYYLVVAGGGGGGGSEFSNRGGSAGAGGVVGGLTSSTFLATASAYTIAVGAGGAGGPRPTAANWDLGRGTNGANSSITGTNAPTAAIGGGAGGRGLDFGTMSNNNGNAGGSGGGAGGAGPGTPGTGGTGTSGQGNAGSGGIVGYGAQGAGGGAGGAASGATGGVGLASSITGSSVTYAAGADAQPVAGGNVVGTAGTDGLGNGGMGGINEAGGKGGDGTVKIFVPDSGGAPAEIVGTAAGTLPLTGSATGVSRVVGATSGTLPLTGPAAGTARATATSSGNLPLTGSADGTGTTIPAGRWVSQTGSDANPGTFASPYATIQYGWSQCTPGETLWIKDDLTPTTFSSTRPAIALSANGTAGNPITLRSWPVGTKRVVDLTNYTGDATGGTGIRVSANYAVLRDFRLTEVKLPGVSAPYIDAVNWRGADGQLLNCEIDQIEGRGLTISEGGAGLAHRLLVENNDIHDCYDPRSSPGYGNSDAIAGYGATTGVEIEGNRIWNCSDDGIDLYFMTEPATVRDNWIWGCGYREDGVTTGGNGSGIKSGSNVASAAHLITRNLIFDCRVVGINANGSTVANTWSYNTIIDTQYAVALWEDGVAHQIVGNVSYGCDATGWIFGNAIVRTRNSFDTPPGITESAAWFISLSRTGVDAARDSSGNLPTITFAHPDTGSALIGAGPSGNTIGAFEGPAGGTAAGTASGTLPLAGSAAGVARATATSSGNLPLAGSAAGVSRVVGAASGALLLTGAAAGAARVVGSAAGTLPLTGTADGVVLSENSGAAAGDLPLAGSTTGEALVIASAAGGLPLAGSSTGIVTDAILTGTAAGDLLLTGVSIGHVIAAGRLAYATSDDRTGALLNDEKPRGEILTARTRAGTVFDMTPE